MIYLTREHLIIHLVVKVLTFSPDGESYMLTIHLKVNCFHLSVKSRRSSFYCFADWRGFIIHPEVNSFHQPVKGLKSCRVQYFILVSINGIELHYSVCLLLFRILVIQFCMNIWMTEKLLLHSYCQFSIHVYLQF